MSEYTTAASEARASALKLLEEREGIDEEIELQLQVLRAQNVTMQSPLIDSEGFPLAQPDLLAVRSARARIIALENDRRATEDRMRSLLEQALARGPNVSSESPVAAQDAVDEQGGVEFVKEVIRHPKAFAAVDSVAIGGPASNAGLRVGDKILRFARFDHTNAHGANSENKLAALPGAVSEGETIEVLIQREGLVKTLRLTPRSGWGGRGLLGCHLTSI